MRVSLIWSADCFCAPSAFRFQCILIVLLSFNTPVLFSQPYIDLIKIYGALSPTAGPSGNTIRYSVAGINVTLPLVLDKKGNTFIVNPFFDQHSVEINDLKFRLNSIGGSAGFLFKDVFRKTDMYTAFVVRNNKESGSDNGYPYQFGGVVLFTLKKDSLLSFKLGTYYNSEFFGNFFVPLVGIDWRISRSSNLFGVLPGSLTYEYKVSKKFYIGASFRAITTSFRLAPGNNGLTGLRKYLRIDDNQLGVFADHYLTGNFVITAEAGYTAFRRYRLTSLQLLGEQETRFRRDNYYLRAGVSYRMRFR
ncbi:MAG TPA: hypothetical protein VGD17_01090 [Chitinophagaceae bacterium]